MRSCLILAGVLILAGRLAAQTVFTDLRGLEKRGDYYYSRLAYVKAADLYSQALKKKKNQRDEGLNRKAARLFKEIARYAEAKQCFENMMHYGCRLTRADSIQYFNTLRATGDLKADSFLTMVYSGALLNSLFRDSLYYNIYGLPFNTERPEYCPVPFQGGILFVSEEEDTSVVKTYNALNNGGFARLYYAARCDTGWLAPARIATGEEDLIHIGPVSFYSDSNAVVNMSREGGMKPYRLQLFSSVFHKNTLTWESFSPLPFNHPDYSVGHPAISRDGKKMFFVSDMEGGIGGTDIYVTEFENGSWTMPRNLGPKINTEGNEKYPCLPEDNILFFSSDGRYGIGGMDVYYADLMFKDSLVVNMGYPVNSPLDDFGFSYDKESRTGYFSSNRKDQGRDDDLYMFTENKIFLDITLYDDFDKKELQEYTVYIADAELSIPVRYSQGDRANIVKASLRPAHTYQVIVHKEDYRDDTLTISTYGMKSYANRISGTVYLKRKPVYYASLRYKNERANEKGTDAWILVNNITSNTLDTLDHNSASASIKLDGDCEYIITSRHGERLWYIYVEKKTFKISASLPYYNLYLGSATPSVLHVRIQSCSPVQEGESFSPQVKVWDRVNRNDFDITPGPEGDFQLVVTDSRLFDLFVDGKKIVRSGKEIISDKYCIKFLK